MGNTSTTHLAINHLFEVPLEITKSEKALLIKVSVDGYSDILIKLEGSKITKRNIVERSYFQYGVEFIQKRMLNLIQNHTCAILKLFQIQKAMNS